jgi:transcriptional regulator with PAS, ATPase and Fis domain
MNSTNAGLFEILCASLPILAEMSCGYAAVTDHNGVRLKTVNSRGEEIVELRGTVYHLAERAYKTCRPLRGKSQLMPDVDAWAIPIGPFVICCNQMESVILMNQIEESLINALPYIRKVVGGDASIFSLKENKVIISTEDIPIQENKLDDNLKKVLFEKKPQVSSSNNVEGAIIVTIPVTNNLGLTLSNETTIKKQKRLYDELKKNKIIRYSLEDFIGENTQILKIKRMVSCVANAASNVLIMGETGTGKEILAQSIHGLSDRANKPFIAINCGALPASLIESQLFGYNQGAFTGASQKGQAGIFEKANGGTVLLDEIGEMDMELQTKLLRILQERTVTRIGSVEPIQLNVRIICTTNKDLYKAIKERTFREDLFFRLNVVNINIPPLRERKEDLPLLVNTFINKYEMQTGKIVKGISPEALSALQQYNWPGNVRELENCIERVFNFINTNEQIEKIHLPEYILDALQNYDSNDIDLKKAIRAAERKVILKAIRIAGGDKKKAAKLLGISDTTLWRKIRCS